jgi:hypothetical protein
MDKEAAVQYVIKNNIDGVFIECGVGDGQFERIWINELKKYNTVRDIYMYDTFSGLTMPGKYDYTCEKASWNMNKDEVLKTWEKQIIDDKTNGWCYTPLEKVKESLEMTGYPSNKLHYIVGDVLQTLQHPENIPDKIAILRLDTDWYESSKFELEKLYPNVVKGGVVIFDDYLHWDGQRRATDEYFANIGESHQFVKINDTVAAMIKN